MAPPPDKSVLSPARPDVSVIITIVLAKIMIIRGNHQSVTTFEGIYTIVSEEFAASVEMIFEGDIRVAALGDAVGVRTGGHIVDFETPVRVSAPVLVESNLHRVINDRGAHGTVPART